MKNLHITACSIITRSISEDSDLACPRAHKLGSHRTALLLVLNCVEACLESFGNCVHIIHAETQWRNKPQNASMRSGLTEDQSMISGVFKN